MSLFENHFYSSHECTCDIYLIVFVCGVFDIQELAKYMQGYHKVTNSQAVQMAALVWFI